MVVIAVDEDELAADRRAEWKRRLDELSARSVQAASRHQYYGMRALASYRANDPRRPTVCLVHGINSSSGGFVHVTPLLEQAGYGIVVFDYPYNQRLDDSCAQFRQRLDRVPQGGRREPAMGDPGPLDGALVARSYVEGEGRTDRDVASMILIAPVNQGAHVARIQPVYQTISSLFAINSKRTTQALAQLSDGIGQAADDLLPGSAFLKRINGGSRPRDVPYHILAGNSGVIPRDIRQQAQAQLDTAARENGLVQHLLPRGQPRDRPAAGRADRRVGRRLRRGRADAPRGGRRPRHHPRQPRRVDPRPPALPRRRASSLHALRPPLAPGRSQAQTPSEPTSRSRPARSLAGPSRVLGFPLGLSNLVPPRAKPQDPKAQRARRGSQMSQTVKS